MSAVDIVFAVDRAYLDQVAVTITSIVANPADPSALVFHVVHAEDPVWVDERIAAWGIGPINTVAVQNPFLDTDLTGRHVSVAALLKTQLPDLLPQLDRAIYIDADIVVLRDIAELHRVDLSGSAMGGVIDIGVYRHMARGEAHGKHAFRDHLISLGLDPQTLNYVNSGLLVMDMRQLRQAGFSAAALELEANRVGPRMFVDQDIFNELMAGETAILDPRWNVLAKGLSRADRRHHHYLSEPLKAAMASQQADSWAIHYIGRQKPWNSADVWGADAWWKYADMTNIGWRRPTPKPASLGTTLADIWLDFRAQLSAWQYAFQSRLRR